jgi:hypothetical protein
MVGLFCPLITYAPVPELVTVYCIDVAVDDNDGVTILKLDGSVVVNEENVRRPFETRTPVIVVDDKFVP